MRKWYADDEKIHRKLDFLLNDIYATFGLKTRFLAPVIGRFVYTRLRKEEAKLRKGWTYEPQMRFEENEAAIRLRQGISKQHPKQPENAPHSSGLNPAYADKVY